MGDLFVISRADIFAIYPQILATILAAENAKRNLIKDFINLPTDSDYQERVYYRLLAVQKAINDLMDSGALVQIKKMSFAFAFHFFLFSALIFLFTVRWMKLAERKIPKRFGIRTVNLF